MLTRWRHRMHTSTGLLWVTHHKTYYGTEMYNSNPNVGNKNRIQWFANPFQPIFNWIHYKYKIFNVQIYAKIHSLGVRCLQHVPKNLGQGHVYHCVTSPFLLTTFNRRLGTEDINSWSFVGGILSHSCLMNNFSCSTVRGLRSRILRFIMRHTFSMGDGSGLQEGQSSTRTLLLWSHAVFGLAAYVAPKPGCTFQH